MVYGMLLISPLKSFLAHTGALQVRLLLSVASCQTTRDQMSFLSLNFCLWEYFLLLGINNANFEDGSHPFSGISEQNWNCVCVCACVMCLPIAVGAVLLYTSGRTTPVLWWSICECVSSSVCLSVCLSVAQSHPVSIVTSCHGAGGRRIFFFLLFFWSQPHVSSVTGAYLFLDLLILYLGPKNSCTSGFRPYLETKPASSKFLLNLQKWVQFLVCFQSFIKNTVPI